MKAKSIFDTVVNMLNKEFVKTNNTDDTESTEDIDFEDSEEHYMDRFSYLAAVFCCIAAAADRDLRETRGLPSQRAFDPVCLKPDDDFPLDDRFSVPAAYYIASMILLTDNERRSEKFFTMFNDSMSAIKKELPFIKGKTVNRYP